MSENVKSNVKGNFADESIKELAKVLKKVSVGSSTELDFLEIGEETNNIAGNESGVTTSTTASANSANNASTDEVDETVSSGNSSIDSTWTSGSSSISDSTNNNTSETATSDKSNIYTKWTTENSKSSKVNDTNANCSNALDDIYNSISNIENYSKFKVSGTNLPAKISTWTKIKNVLCYEIKVELTPYQQKIEDEINEFLHQEITWKSVKNFLLKEVPITYKGKRVF